MAEEEREELVEPLLPEPEPQELPDPSPVLEESSESVETAPLLEEEDTSSEEEPPPPPKRVRSSAAAARSAKARVEPKAKAEPKAEPKRRGRPPGARNVVRAPVEPAQYPTAAELPAQCPMEQIMASMRERRQAHQERQHMFFQSFLPS